jgi:hypothetical protein
LQLHGFLAARGEWDKPEVLAGANKAINILVTFFKANV